MEIDAAYDLLETNIPPTFSAGFLSLDLNFWQKN